MKQWMIPTFSTLVGLLAFAMTHVYLKKQNADYLAKLRALEQSQESVRVVAAAENIDSYKRIKREHLGARTILKKDLDTNHILAEDFAIIVGKQAITSIQKNNFIRWKDVDVDIRRALGLAGRIRQGLRAVSIAVGGNNAVSSLISPNDRVDVLGTFSFPSSSSTAGEVENVTLTILQDVSVLAVGQEIDAVRTRQGRSRGYSTVTLETTPQEAELLVFAQNSHGRLTLTLRNPEDGDYLPEQNLQDVNFEHLRDKIPVYNEIRQRDVRKNTNR